MPETVYLGTLTTMGHQFVTFDMSYRATLDALRRKWEAAYVTPWSEVADCVTITLLARGEVVDL